MPSLDMQPKTSKNLLQKAGPNYATTQPRVMSQEQLAALSRIGIDPSSLPAPDYGVISSAYGPEDAEAEIVSVIGQPPTP